MKRLNLTDMLAVGLFFSGLFIVSLSFALNLNLLTQSLGIIGGLLLSFSQAVFLFQKFVK